MARFRATIQETRGGRVSRLGHRELRATVNGWKTTGCRVEMSRAEDGADGAPRDVVRVYRTGGSNGGGAVLVASWLTGGATARPSPDNDDMGSTLASSGGAVRS